MNDFIKNFLEDEEKKFLISNSDCLTFNRFIPDESISAVVTDPPYGEDMGFSGDENISTAVDLLTESAKGWYRILKPNGMVAVFWASRSVDQAIDSLKSSGLTFRRILNMYIPKGGARPYMAWLPRTQPILLFQKYLPKQPSEIHGLLCDFLNDAIKKKGVTKKQISDHLGCNSRLVMKWTRKDDPSWCLPTPRFYIELKKYLALDDSMDFFLTREPSRGPTRDYEYVHDTYIVNETVKTIYDHPCQKPIRVLEHLCHSLSEEGGVVFDPFMGSGTTGEACLNKGRKFIGTEINEDFFKLSDERLKSI